MVSILAQEENGETYCDPSINGSPSLWNSLVVSCQPSSIIKNLAGVPPSDKLTEKQRSIRDQEATKKQQEQKNLQELYSRNETENGQYLYNGTKKYFYYIF